MSCAKLRTEHVNESYHQNDSSVSKFPGLRLWRNTCLPLLMVVVVSFKVVPFQFQVTCQAFRPLLGLTCGNRVSESQRLLLNCRDNLETTPS